MVPNFIYFLVIYVIHPADAKNTTLGSSLLCGDEEKNATKGPLRMHFFHLSLAPLPEGGPGVYS